MSGTDKKEWGWVSLETENIHRKGKIWVDYRVFRVLGSGGRMEDRPQQAVCYRAGDETEEIGQEEHHLPEFRSVVTAGALRRKGFLGISVLFNEIGMA